MLAFSSIIFARWLGLCVQ